MKYCDVATAEDVDTKDGKVGKFAFIITPRNSAGGPRELELRVATADERDSWMDAMKSAGQPTVPVAANEGIVVRKNRGKTLMSNLVSDAPLLEGDEGEVSGSTNPEGEAPLGEEVPAWAT